MKRPESPCLDCQLRSEGCHAPGACGNTGYTYDEYTADMAQYREAVKTARMSKYMGEITDSMRFHRKKRKRG